MRARARARARVCVCVCVCVRVCVCVCECARARGFVVQDSSDVCLRMHTRVMCLFLHNCVLVGCVCSYVSE